MGGRVLCIRITWFILIEVSAICFKERGGLLCIRLTWFVLNEVSGIFFFVHP